MNLQLLASEHVGTAVTVRLNFQHVPLLAG